MVHCIFLTVKGQYGIMDPAKNSIKCHFGRHLSSFDAVGTTKRLLKADPKALFKRIPLLLMENRNGYSDATRDGDH